MADRCEHCLVRMDGLEVHSDDCPVRGPEIREENDALKLQIEELKKQSKTDIHVMGEISKARDSIVAERDAALLQNQELQKALANIRQMLGTGACKANKCDGCQFEMEEAARIVKKYIEKRSEISPLCMVQTGCMGGTCGKLLPCEDHPPKCICGAGFHSNCEIHG